MSDKILVTAKEASEMLSIGVSEVYAIAARGDIPKRYIGKGQREFRLHVDDIRSFAKGLPTEPVPS